MRVYWQLTVGFARSGVLGYGGGPSVIPLIEHEAVKKFGWMSDEEFGDTLALANTLPGPIATKMAAYIGYKIKGGLGATVSVLAHILPSLLAMIILLGFLYSFRDHPIISGMIQSVTPVVAVMLLIMTFDFLKKSRKGLGIKWMLLTVALCIIFTQLLFIHPGIVIICFLSASFIFATYTLKNENKRNEKEMDT